MPLTQEESDFVDRYLEQLPQRGPNQYIWLPPDNEISVLVCAFRDANCDTRYTGPGHVQQRLVTAESYYQYDACDGDCNVRATVAIGDRRGVIAMDWFPLKEDRDDWGIKALNAADAVVLAYDDTNRESFEAVVEFNNMMKGLSIVPPDPSIGLYPGSRRSPTRAKAESPWRRLKLHIQNMRKHGEQKASDTGEPAASAAKIDQDPKMDPGPKPKLIVANRCIDRPCVVSREEGEELAKKVGAEFYMISTQMLNWGDCDILDRLYPRLLFQRACGRKKAFNYGRETLMYAYE